MRTPKFAYHFLRGRDALFKSQPTKAKEHFARAVQLGKSNPLYAEALLFLADSQEQGGELIPSQGLPSALTLRG